MTDKFRKTIISGIFTFGILIFPSAIFAATNIDTDIPLGPIITENNILPGDVFSRVITVTKLSGGGQSENLMIRFDANETGNQLYSLSQKILVSIKRIYDGNLMTLPSGTTQQSLEELYDVYSDPNDPNNNNGAFIFDTIYGIAGSTYQYQILFTFDPATEDKNFQGQATRFNISVGIYSNNMQAQADDNGSDGHNRHHRRKTNDSNVGVLAGSLSNQTENSIDSNEENSAEEDRNKVMGDESVGGEISGVADQRQNWLERNRFFSVFIVFTLAVMAGTVASRYFL